VVEERDWFSVLATMLREDEVDVPTMSPTDVDALIAGILDGRIGASGSARPLRRRRRRRWIAGGIAIGVLAGGATAAAVWRSSRPDHPQEGIACHSTAHPSDYTDVIPANADPIAACSQLWSSGAMANGGTAVSATGFTPPAAMFVCIGSGGGLDVFPQISDPAVSCSDLGLADAITATLPTEALQSRLSTDINLGCRSLDEARSLAVAALTDLGLRDWTVTVHEVVGPCVRAGADPATRSVFLFAPPT
jgi:Cell wall synthesis protein CwsA